MGKKTQLMESADHKGRRRAGGLGSHEGQAGVGGVGGGESGGVVDTRRKVTSSNSLKSRMGSPNTPQQMQRLAAEELMRHNPGFYPSPSQTMPSSNLYFPHANPMYFPAPNTFSPHPTTVHSLPRRGLAGQSSNKVVGGGFYFYRPSVSQFSPESVVSSSGYMTPTSPSHIYSTTGISSRNPNNGKTRVHQSAVGQLFSTAEQQQRDNPQQLQQHKLAPKKQLSRTGSQLSGGPAVMPKPSPVSPYSQLYNSSTSSISSSSSSKSAKERTQHREDSTQLSVAKTVVATDIERDEKKPSRRQLGGIKQLLKKQLSADDCTTAPMRHRHRSNSDSRLRSPQADNRRWLLSVQREDNQDGRPQFVVATSPSVGSPAPTLDVVAGDHHCNSSTHPSFIDRLTGRAGVPRKRSYSENNIDLVLDMIVDTDGENGGQTHRHRGSNNSSRSSLSQGCSGDGATGRETNFPFSPFFYTSIEKGLLCDDPRSPYAFTMNPSQQHSKKRHLRKKLGIKKTWCIFLIFAVFSVGGLVILLVYLDCSTDVMKHGMP